jgi:hypothetical protein
MWWLIGAVVAFLAGLLAGPLVIDLAHGVWRALR